MLPVLGHYFPEMCNRAHSISILQSTRNPEEYFSKTKNYYALVS